MAIAPLVLRPPFPERVTLYPQLRYMGSKFRLLHWIHEILSDLDFDTALDAFSGSGCVAYLLKSMGKQVTSNDFLNFSSQIALATVENSTVTLTEGQVQALLRTNSRSQRFIERTFRGIFFTPEDLRFLDNVWANLRELPSPHHVALALAALIRGCVKRQPRGVFTVAGDPERYKDGRRDVQIGLRQHFQEGVQSYNRVVYDNGRSHTALHGDIFSVRGHFDLVYMDPPYVPRADDNCYIKRYHFLEGLSSYWRGDGAEILADSAVKKLRKRFTPFSYRRTAVAAFDSLFRQFRDSILVLSYSSNGYPDLPVLIDLMKRYKSSVDVFERDHRYHFGTHENVSSNRVVVREYLLVGA